MPEGKTALENFVRRAADAALASAGTGPRQATSRPVRTAPLDIVIPIYNNAPLLRRCLDALRVTLSDGDSVWLVDDASTEPGIERLTAEFAEGWPDTRCLRNPFNLGFVGTSNRAIEATARDVVLLNSDTEPTPGWLEQMQDCLQRNPQAGIVCPLADRATLLSVVPESARGADAKPLQVMAASTAGDVPLPTAVGFCMLMRRDMLRQIGKFSQAFAPGYGEENDLSMRALQAGWEILAADRASVFHHSGGSFGESRGSALRKLHQKRLDRIWPEYAPLVQSWWRDNPLRVRAEQLAGAGDARETVVHVLHRQYLVGGTERVARSLIDTLGDRYRHVLVYPGETENAWCDMELRDVSPCRELMLNKRWIRPGVRIAGHGADLSCPQSERSLARIIVGSNARIVHFHHMLHWDSLLLPAVARRLGCRVVIHVHDFWFNCPIHNQLEHATGRPCGRSHAQADDRCSACLDAWSPGQNLAGPKLHDYVHARHALVRELLQQSDAVIAPSGFIRDKLLAAWPDIRPDRVTVEPHGVRLPAKPPAAARNADCVLGYFGGDQALKGAELVLQIAHALAGSGVRIRIHGRIKGFNPATVPANVELRGFYNPDGLGEVMQDIDLALVPSFYEESFSMIVSECWAHGVPVLASDRGALAERVIDGINGWRVPDMQPSSWINALRQVMQGDSLDDCRRQLARQPVVDIGQAAETLAGIYGSLLAEPRAEPVRAASPAYPRRFLEKLVQLRAGPPLNPLSEVCLGVLRDHWGTAAYRGRFPLLDLARSGHRRSSHFHIVRDAGFDPEPLLRESRAKHILLQPFLADEGLGMMERLHRASCHHVTLVIDDLWTDLHEDNPVRGLMPEDIGERLAYAAGLAHTVVLTTPELERRLNLRHDNTHVINNALPAWVWGALRNATAKETGRRLRIGWAGAPQHGADLGFLATVIRATSELADWVFLGMCPDELLPLGAEFHGMVPFQEYPARLANLGLDLAIAPLADTPFNRCKSHLKVLECGILGLPMVAADLEPYRECPLPRAAPDDADEWIAALRRLLLDREERTELGRSLRNWVLDNHMTEHRRAAWAAALGMEDDAG